VFGLGAASGSRAVRLYFTQPRPPDLLDSAKELFEDAIFGAGTEPPASPMSVRSRTLVSQRHCREVICPNQAHALLFRISGCRSLTLNRLGSPLVRFSGGGALPPKSPPLTARRDTHLSPAPQRDHRAAPARAPISVAM